MDKSGRQNRVREALGRLYDQQPPYFQEYLRRYKEDPTSRVFAPLAEAYRRLGQVDEALELCREGLEHHPDFHGGRVALAKCYIEKKRFADARTELERVVSAVPENLMAQRLLGDVYAQLENWHAALHCFKMALLLSPADVTLAEKVHSVEKRTTALNKVTGDDDIPPFWSSDAAEAANYGSGSGQPGLELQPIDEGPTGPFAADADLSDDFDAGSAPEDEAFKIEHLSAIFGAENQTKKEITTETLGDLYLSQGQFDRALRIFEKLKPTPEVNKKVDLCREGLGVDVGSRARNRKIAILQKVLKKVKAESAALAE